VELVHGRDLRAVRTPARQQPGHAAVPGVRQGLRPLPAGRLAAVEQDPSDRRRRASAVASGLTVGGAAAGPLLAGLLAQYAVLPLRLSFLIEVALLAVALAAAWHWPVPPRR
jgi:MFS family permease